jgi:hypothetical protein
MPHQGFKDKEARREFTGGATKSIFIAGVDEAAHNSRKNEEIPGLAHSTTTDHYPSG